MTSNHTSQTAPTRAARLIFEYDGVQVSLVSQQVVDLAVTGLDLTRAQHPGIYVEVRDSAGRTLARVPARNAFSGSVEIFPENASEAIVRMDVAKAKGAFTVVVPVPAEANQVTVVRLATAPQEQLPAKKIIPAGSLRVTKSSRGRHIHLFR